MFGKIRTALKRLFFYRSSQTGRFVSQEYAERHPDVTEKERR